MKRATRLVAGCFVCIGVLALALGVGNGLILISVFALLMLFGSIGLLLGSVRGWWILTFCCSLLVLFDVYAVVLKCMEWHRLGYLFIDNGFQLVFGLIYLLVFPLSAVALLSDHPSKWRRGTQVPQLETED